jgi:hypothetical protein
MPLLPEEGLYAPFTSLQSYFSMCESGNECMIFVMVQLCQSNDFGSLELRIQFAIRVLALLFAFQLVTPHSVALFLLRHSWNVGQLMYRW